MKQTLEELTDQIKALNLPDVSVEEVLTLVREPLAHVGFKQEGGNVRVWTHACVFILNLETLRISVAPAETVGLMQASKLVQTADAQPKPTRASRRARRGEVEDQLHEPKKPAAPEITDSLANDEGTVQMQEGGEA